MNKLIIPIIIVAVIAIGIGAFFVFQKPAFPEQLLTQKPVFQKPAFPEPPMEPQPPTDNCPQIMPPSPILKEQCEKDGGKLEPKKNEKGCVIGYECEKEVVAPPTISTLSLLKKVDIENGARPEVVATDNRVFVVYLDTSTPQSSKFSVKIFDEDMNTEIAYKTLVTRSSEYGSPTDIRVASDGNYVYAFYEAADLTAKKSYLFGAKYNLNDGFERVAYTDLIATSKSYGSHLPTDEHMDDPIVLISQNSVFSMTRILSSSAYTYVVREFDKNLNFKKSFNIELSSIAQSKGDYGQASAVYYNGYYYMVIPSMKGVASLDLFLVKLDMNWNIVDYRFISQSSKDEYFVTGMQVYRDYFFVVYKEGSIADAFSILKVFDNDFNEVISTTVKKVEVKGESLRPSLSVNNEKILIGLPTGGGPPPMSSGSKTFGTGTGETRKASIYIFEKK